MKFTKLALTLMCSMMLFCACTKSGDVVLKINDESITKGDYYADFNRIKNAQFKNAPKEYQKDDSYPVLVLKDRYTNDVIIRKLLEQEFTKRKIQASTDEINQRKKLIAQQVGSEEQLKKILAENNISDEKFTSDMASEVKIEKLINQLGGAKVSDKDVETYYKQNKAQFELPERVQVAHILIETNPESIKRKLADADKGAKLSESKLDEKVQEEVKRKETLALETWKKVMGNPTPANFAEVAKQYSEDKESAKNGGDLGYISRGQMVPEFERAAFSQKVGVVGPLVKSQYGQHIILVKDKSAKGIQTLPQVKEDLKKMLLNQKKSEVLQKYITGLKDNAKIEYVDSSLNPENLKKQIEAALSKQSQAQGASAPAPAPQGAPEKPAK